MSSYIIDTDTFIELLKSNPNALKNLRKSISVGSFVAISIITYYETLRGIKYVSSQKKAKKFVSLMARTNVIPLNESICDKAVDIYVRLRKRGELIEEPDILIAAIALENICILVTNNISHFERIEGLSLKNWVTI